MSIEHPERLSRGDELGQLLQDAAADSDMSAARLDASAAVIAKRLALPAGSLLASVAKWSLLLALAGGAVVVGTMAATGPGKRSEPAATPAIAADAATGLPDASLAVPVEAPLVGAVDAAVKPPEPLAQQGDDGRRKPAPRRRPRPDAAPPPDDAGPPPSVELAEQLRLYERATRLGRAGQYAQGIELIDELLARYPQSLVRPDALLTKAELLMRAGDDRAALALFEHLVRDPAHHRRKGELWRVLGDLHRKLGDCAKAFEAYETAHESSLSSREAAAVARGMKMCR